MRVLIAEDDAHIRQGLAEVCEAQGYEVIQARDGKEALLRFEQTEPDLALLDIMMPGADGYDVCREIRRQREGVGVIFISAKSEEIDRVVGLELGADDFIVKPFGVREVVARIRAVARRTLAAKRAAGQGASDEPFSMDDLTVYPDELRARRGDQVIDLSLREVGILALLHRERGKVVDREKLFNECWGMNYLPRSRTLDQQISKLRKLVEVDPKNPRIIHTVHGVGYRYEGE